jgi:hypothetical protein
MKNTAEENNWTFERGSNRRVEKIHKEELYN